jgi:hypothetical protein
VNTTDSFQALRRANPRGHAGFAASVEAAREAVRTRIATADRDAPRRSRRIVRLSTAGVVVAVALTAFVAIFHLGGGAGVEDATAALRQAATVTAASAERSGTAVVLITHDGEDWAGSTIRWNGNDISISRVHPTRDGRFGDELRVVDGLLYGPDGAGGWLELGSPRNIDPDSGTTPDETLAAVREDVGGMTLRRLTSGMSGLTRTTLDDGSTVYRGTVAAGSIARETGFKEGQAIRVLPFGYVAHDAAADPASLLNTAITVDPAGVVRELAVSWGTWRYTVVYSSLGATPAPAVPPNVHGLKRQVGSD